MKFTVFLQDVKEDVFMRQLLTNFCCHGSCVCKSLKTDKSRLVSNRKKLPIPVDRS